jgi:hypothetical protein
MGKGGRKGVGRQNVRSGDMLSVASKQCVVLEYAPFTPSIVASTPACPNTLLISNPSFFNHCPYSPATFTLIIGLSSPPSITSLPRCALANSSNPTGTPKHQARGNSIPHLAIKSLKSLSSPGTTLTKIRSESHLGSECTAPSSSPSLKNAT